MKTTKKASQKKSMSASHSKEVARILKANKGLDESYAPFVRAFAAHLVREAEAPVAAPDEFTQDKNEEDFNNSLEPETDSADFQTQGTDPQAPANVITAIKEWANKLNDFADFMNAPDTQSLHSILASEDRPGSLMRGVTRKASDSITRIAGEISKLKEVLNSFIIMAPKKGRDAAQQTAQAAPAAGGAPAAGAV